MKNKFKLLPLAFLGSLFVGESYADENFFRAPTTFQTGFLGITNPRFSSPDDIIDHWQLVYDFNFSNCLAFVQANDPFLYTCNQLFVNILGPEEGAVVINGQSNVLYETRTLAHEWFLNPETGRRDFRIRPVEQVHVARMSLRTNCPEGLSTRTYRQDSGERDVYCVIPDSVSANIFSVGNPINYVSRLKYDVEHDFTGRAGLVLDRYYRNQSEGWTLDGSYQLVDLYNAGVGVPVAVDFKSFLMERPESTLNVEDNVIEAQLVLEGVQTQYIAPDEENRKVLIADQYGITQSFLGGPTVFRSSVDSSVLTYLSENNETPDSWKLVDSSGVQQFFNSSGDVTEIRYPNGDIIFYQYDANNRVVRKENKFGDYISYEYDANGNAVKATVMPENAVFDYSYESIGEGVESYRLTKVKKNQIAKLTYQYDNPEYPFAMTSVTNGDDITLAHWGYNTDGDAVLTSPNNIESFELNYNQTVFGPRIIGGSEFNLGRGPIVENPDGSTTAHAIQRIAEYDREVATIDRSEGIVTGIRFFTYDSDGNLTSETDSNGDVTVKVYDENRYLIEETSGYRWRGGSARYGVLSNPVSSLTAVDTETTHHCWNTETGLRTRTITDDIVATFVYSELGQIINTIEEPANSTNNTCD